MSEHGFCPFDETPLVEDVEFNKRFEDLIAIYGGALVLCPKCGCSWHADNPYILTKVSDYVNSIIAIGRKRSLLSKIRCIHRNIFMRMRRCSKK